MAQWQAPRYKFSRLRSGYGGGVNNGVTAFNIKDDQLTDMRNMKSDDYPSLSVRDARTTYADSLATTDLNAFGVRDNSVLHVATSDAWKYWDTGTTAWVDIGTSLSNIEANFVDFSVGSVLQTLYFSTGGAFGWKNDGTTRYSLTNDAPKSNKAATYAGRIYAIEGKQLKYSAFEKSTDWTTAEDAGFISVTNAKGDATGIREYADHIIIWTEQSMHELYGSSPVNYKLVDISNDIGCVSNKSIQEVRGRLYWMDFEGVYAYTGGEPKKVSEEVDGYIKQINWDHKTKITAGSNGDKLYMAIPYGSTATENNLILVYDILNKVWCVEDGNFDEFATIGNTLYGMESSAGQIYNMINGTATTDISWYFNTKPFYTASKQTVADMYNVYKANANANVNLDYSTSASSTSFNSLMDTTDFTYTGVETRDKFYVPTTDLKQEDWYRWKYSGTGDFTFYFAEENVKEIRR